MLSCLKTMTNFDLNNLPIDVFTLSNEKFHDFVIQVCGELEADVLQIQGIRNASTFLRSTNVLAILDLDCEEVNVLKSNVCFKCKNGEYVVKQGVKLNFDNLYDALKAKYDKDKKVKQRRELPPSVPNMQTPSTNLDDNNNPTDSNPSEVAKNTSIGSTITLSTTNTKPSNSLSSKFLSVNDHVVFIKDLIEKYSRKVFKSTILKHDEHYSLSVTNSEQTFKAIIKCKCGTKIVLPSRSDTSTFILSNFYAHLTASLCPIVKRITEEEEVASDSQSISISSIRVAIVDSINDDSTSSNRSKRKHTDGDSHATSTSTRPKRKR